MSLEPQVIDAVVMIDNEIIDAETNVVVVHEDTPHYAGEYVVIPKAHDSTVLETKDKVMDDNVTVQEVPYYETSNEQGTTVYIAREV